MIEVACQCGGLPPHDHWIRTEKPFVDEDRYLTHGYFDMDDIGRVWVDWKAVARALTTETEREP